MPNFSSIIEEAGLGPNWVEVDHPPIVPGAPAPPPVSSLTPIVPQYMQGTIPPNVQHDSHFVDTAQPTSIAPKFSLMPLGVQGSPISNAAVESTAIKIVESTPGVASGITTVGLTAPKELVVANSPLTPPGGTIALTWASETSGYIFQAPPPGLSAWQGATQATFLSVIGGGTMSVSQTPTSATSLGLIWQNGGTNFAFPSGWTQVGAPGTLFGYKSISGTSPVSVSYSVGSQIDGTAFITLFNGPAPSLVQSAQGNTASGSVAFGGANTAGNTLIIAVKGSMSSPAGPISIVISDSNGNVYSQIVNQSFVGKDTGTNIDFQTTVWVAPNCLGGSNTVTWSISGPGTISTPVMVAMEFGALGTGSSIPFFAPLNTGSIPPINLGASGNGGVGGDLPVANGGTGKTTLTAHGVLIGEGTSAIAATSAGIAGQVLTSNGFTADPTFQGAAVQVATTSLTSAQLLALVGTPVTLVAAPGSGFTILPLSITIILFGGSAAYTDAGGAVSFNIGSATQALASNAIFTTATSPNKQIQRVAGFAATDTAGNPPTDDNAVMTISKATNNLAAGNGTAKVIVHYIVVPTT